MVAPRRSPEEQESVPGRAVYEDCCSIAGQRELATSLMAVLRRAGESETRRAPSFLTVRLFPLREEAFDVKGVSDLR